MPLVVDCRFYLEPELPHILLPLTASEVAFQFHRVQHENHEFSLGGLYDQETPSCQLPTNEPSHRWHKFYLRRGCMGW